VKTCLTAKFIDENKTIEPVSGTPQGGIPTIVNMTLNRVE